MITLTAGQAIISCLILLVAGFALSAILGRGTDPAPGLDESHSATRYGSMASRVDTPTPVEPLDEPGRPS